VVVVADAAIDIQGLVKTFGPHRALDGLDLSVARGEVHGYLGPNGAGKSTTIRVLLGLLRKDEGTGQWLYTEPDWEKLRAVVTGHGPASEERLAFRRMSREDVAWVERVVLAEAA